MNKRRITIIQMIIFKIVIVRIQIIKDIISKQIEEVSGHQHKDSKETSLEKVKEIKHNLPKKKFDYFKFLTKPKQKSGNDHYNYLNN